MKPSSRYLVGLSIASAAMLPARDATACSREACPRSVLLPAAPGDTSAMIPLNLPALAWGSARAERAPTGSDVRLVREGPMPVAIATTLTRIDERSAVWSVRPSEPWVMGARYSFSVESVCNITPSQPGPGASTSFIVGPAIPLPTSLGTLTMGPQSQAVMVVPPDSFDGTCGTTAEVASRTPSLVLSPEASAWRSLLLVQLLVDGQPRGLLRDGDGATIPSRNTFDGPDQLPYVVCSLPSSAAGYGLSPGRHRYQFRASLPGSSEVLRSNEVEAEIVCGPLVGDGGVGDGGVAARDVPTALVDATSAPEDVVAPAGDAASASDAGVGAPMGGGGGCAAAPSSSGRGPVACLALAALALARSRRRRAAGACRG